jgi:hypothetical protein
MAKKIRLDFSKTEERSGWNTKHIDEGLHKMKIEGVQETEAQDGTAMLIFAMVPEDPKLKTRRFPFYCKLQPNQLWKLRDLLVSAGQTVPKKIVSIDPGVVVGKFIAAEVEDDNYQGNLRSTINGTYGLEILDDEDGAAPEDDEDEETEYDETESEEADEEEYEEEDDEEEEEEEEDLNDLSIGDLRARAKALGIVTLKKPKAALIDEIIDAEAEGEADEDEDELEDEDLEDEELADEEFEDDEEEEEEPAPAPTRRAAPVRKAAPAAKAAPAKRAVTRRR